MSRTGEGTLCWRCSRDRGEVHEHCRHSAALDLTLRALIGLLVSAAVLAFLLIGTRREWTYNEWGNAATWFGAVGSLFAGGAALWIATTDRRRTDGKQYLTEQRAAFDLAREAGLVRIQTDLVQAPVAITPADTAVGVTLRNWRKSSLFDVRLDRLTVAGREIFPVELDRPCGALYFPEEKKKESILCADELARKVIPPGTIVSWVPKGADTVPDSAVVRYTDDSGRRWEVDSTSILARRVD